MVKVFYSPHQSVASNVSFSPSAGKPERLLAQWRERYPVQVVEPQPVSEKGLTLGAGAYVLQVGKRKFVRVTLA